MAEFGNYGPPGTFSVFEKAAAQGVMVLVFADTTKSVVHLENHVPEMAAKFISGEIQPNPMWKVFVRMKVNAKKGASETIRGKFTTSRT